MDPRDALVWLLARLPLGLRAALASVCAWLWWVLVPIRRAEALDALGQAFPEQGASWRGQILRRMMRDQVLSYLEWLSPERLQVEVVGWEGPRASPGPMLGGHLGASEITLHFMGEYIPVGLLVKVPASPWVAGLMARLRGRAQTRYIDAAKTKMEDVYRELDEGRSLIFVQDQRFAKGLKVPFFGRPALTSAGFAAAVLRYPDRAVWTIHPVRLGVGKHRLIFARFELPALTGDKRKDVELLTIASNQWYEARIREQPESWLWLHRRWSLR